MIEKNDIEHIADLSRINLTDAEKEKFQKDIDEILIYVEKLKQLNLDDIEPMNHLIGKDSTLREDYSEDSDSRDAIIELFPEKEKNFLKVKSILQ